MKRFLVGIPLALLAIALVVLIVANRGSVTVSLAPLPYAWSVPLYLVFFGGVIAGAVAAAVLYEVRRVRAGLKAARERREKAALERQVRDLERSLDADAGEEDETAGAGAQRALAKH